MMFFPRWPLFQPSSPDRGSPHGCFNCCRHHIRLKDVVLYLDPIAACQSVHNGSGVSTTAMDLDVTLIDIAPAPRRATLEGGDDRVIGFLVMPHGMAVFGVVRTTDLAAGETHPQLHPTAATRKAHHAPAGPRAGRADGLVVSARIPVPCCLGSPSVNLASAPRSGSTIR
jgi:hypothetical protein